MVATESFLGWSTRGERSTDRAGFSALFNLEEPLAVFDRLTVFDENLQNRALGFGLDLIHDFHRFDDADDRVLDDLRSRIGIWLTFG